MRYLVCGIVLGFVLVGAAALPAFAAANEPAALRVESSAFAPNADIPSLYTCEGKDISPPLSWSGIPKGTKSFALIVDDPDAPDPAAPKKTWVHWVIYNIPVDTSGLPEGVSEPAGASQGPNDWGSPDYRGPCPPVGRHRYFFKLYALDAVFVPQKPLDKAALEKAMIGHTLTQATMIGTYEHAQQ